MSDSLYRLKLDSNAVTIYKGAYVDSSLPVVLENLFSELHESYSNRITLPAGNQVLLPQINGSVSLCILVVRKPVMSSSLVIPSPMVVIANCDKLAPNTSLGEFNVWAFPDGVNGMKLKNQSTYDVIIQFMSVKSMTITQSVPSRITNLTSTKNATGVNLAWLPSLLDGGTPVIGYTVKYGLKEITQDNYVTLNVPDPITIASISGLLTGRNYTFLVSSYNLIGQSLPTSIDIVPSDLPPIVSNIITTSVGPQVTTTWTVPIGSLNFPITGYKVEVLDNINSPVVTFNLAVTDPMSITFTGVVDRIYSIIVYTINQIGQSPSLSVYYMPTPPVISSAYYDGTYLHFNLFSGTNLTFYLQIRKLNDIPWIAVDTLHTSGFYTQNCFQDTKIKDFFFPIVSGEMFQMRVINTSLDPLTASAVVLIVAP